MSPPTLSGPGETGVAAELAAAWRDAAEATLRYWGRLGRLAFESVTALVPVVEELRPPAPSPAPAVPRTILVEGDTGETGLGMFLIENTTRRELSIPISVSSFLDDGGGEVRPRVGFRPATITLDPGEQTVVQVALAIDETLAPGVRYHGEISIPGLAPTRIPIVVRRRTGVATRATGRPKAKTQAA